MGDLSQRCNSRRISGTPLVSARADDGGSKRSPSFLQCSAGSGGGCRSDAPAGQKGGRSDRDLARGQYDRTKEDRCAPASVCGGEKGVSPRAPRPRGRAVHPHAGFPASTVRTDPFGCSPNLGTPRLGSRLPASCPCLANLRGRGLWSAGHRGYGVWRSEEHTSELQSRLHLVCRLLLEKKKTSH